MTYLIIFIEKFLESEKLRKYFIRGYTSQDKDGKNIFVIPSADCLGYAKEAAGLLDRDVKACGMKSDGTKFKLLGNEE